MDTEFLDRIKTVIEDRLAALAQASDDTVEARAVVTLDQQSVGRLSRMDALQQQAMAKATEARRATEIARLRAALRQLQQGEFGYCVDCGEEIGTERLLRAPTAPKCLSCARG